MGGLGILVGSVEGRMRQGGKAGYIGGKCERETRGLVYWWEVWRENETRQEGWYISGRCERENETRREGRYIGGKCGGENETRWESWYIRGTCEGESETRWEGWVFWWEVWRGE